MDRIDEQPPTPPVAPLPTTILRPALMAAEWNVVLACVAKGPIETHLDLFVKLKQALESELRKGASP